MDELERLFLQPLNDHEELLIKQRMNAIINFEHKITWKRTQKLNNMANAIVDRMIEKHFENKFRVPVNIIKYDFDTETVVNQTKPESATEHDPYGTDALIGYIEMIKGVFNWEAKKGQEEIPLNKEIRYVIDEKVKYVFKALNKACFSDYESGKMVQKNLLS